VPGASHAYLEIEIRTTERAAEPIALLALHVRTLLCFCAYGNARPAVRRGRRSLRATESPNIGTKHRHHAFAAAATIRARAARGLSISISEVACMHRALVWRSRAAAPLAVVDAP